MPIEIRWHNPQKTIIIYRVIGRWGEAEAAQLVAEVDELLLEVEGTVDLIADFSEAGSPPANFIDLARDLTTNQPPQLGQIAVIGVQLYMRLMLQVLRNVYPQHLKNIYPLRSLEEAEQFLHEQRTKDAGARG